MTPYGKSAQTAIAAVSRLAEVFDTANRVKLNSAEIAQKRSLPQPIVAKVLSILSQAKIVNGSPGPGGGYWLARPPEKVTLFDVVTQFERVEENVSCPFGPHYCGNGPHCPLHPELLKVREQMIAFLQTNTFATFANPVPTEPAQGKTKGRKSLNILPRK